MADNNLQVFILQLFVIFLGKSDKFWAGFERGIKAASIEEGVKVSGIKIACDLKWSLQWQRRWLWGWISKGIKTQQLSEGGKWLIRVGGRIQPLQTRVTKRKRVQLAWGSYGSFILGAAKQRAVLARIKRWESSNNWVIKIRVKWRAGR